MLWKRKAHFAVGDVFAVPCPGGFGLARLALTVTQEAHWQLAGDWLEVLPRVYSQIPSEPCAEFDSIRITGWFEHGSCDLWVELDDIQKIGHCDAPTLD